MAIQKGPTPDHFNVGGTASHRPGKASVDLPAPRLCGAGLCLPQAELAELPPAKAGAMGNRLLATQKGATADHPSFLAMLSLNRKLSPFMARMWA